MVKRHIQLCEGQRKPGHNKAVKEARFQHSTCHIRQRIGTFNVHPRQHRLYSAVSVISPQGQVLWDIDVAVCQRHDLPAAVSAYYPASAYELQLGAALEGCLCTTHSSVSSTVLG
jgi:hypothetical protein